MQRTISEDLKLSRGECDDVSGTKLGLLYWHLLLFVEKVCGAGLSYIFLSSCSVSITIKNVNILDTLRPGIIKV